MESADESLSECLLQWVRSFEGTGQVQDLEDLEDGLLLWSILHSIDASYFSGALPEPGVDKSSDWTRKWQNLKHVEKQVSMYYRDICNGQEHISIDSLPDVKAIAAESSTLDLEKLLMTIIRAAMASPVSNQTMAQRLMGLGRTNAMLIANELRSMEEADQVESGSVSRDESADHSEQEEVEEEEQKPKTNGSKVGGDMYQDPLLEREEQLLQAQATIDTLEASQTEAQRQLQELRQEKERLEEAFDTYRNEIDTKGRKAAGDDAFKKLQRQIDNDRAYIEDLESQLQSSRGVVEKYEHQFQRYKDENEDSQKLRDELQLLKADNEDLAQKIKANENLKKKIVTLQEQEKVNATLREEIKQANERLEALDRLKKVQAALEKEIIEKQGLIRNQEYQINELTTTRKHAEHEARVLAQKLQDARERHDRDHETIQELRGRQDGKPEELDTEEALATTTTSGSKTNDEQEPKQAAQTNDESQFLNEKIALLQEQLSTADVRLKQASERNAELEEQNRSANPDSSSSNDAMRTTLQDHEETIANLRKDLLKAKADAPSPSQDFATLQRENRLMASAWYDLSRRIQNNGVSLASRRRREEPKSWIGRQRALVGPGTGPPR